VRSAGPRGLQPHEAAYALPLSADSADGAETAPASTGRRPPTPRPRGIASREAFVARAFLLVGFVCWATRTEKFPFTGMQMFSRSHVPEPVEYVRPLVRYDDGVVERARFERWIGAMADTRYRWLLRDWSSRPERIELLREFLDACARRANVSSAAGRRIRQFELEVRRWDFQRYPADPNRGQLLYVLRHNVDRAERAWAPTRPQS
jgi:hypothetical protein